MAFIEVHRKDVPVVHVELTGGNYLDLLGALRPHVDATERAHTTIRDASTGLLSVIGTDGCDLETISHIYFYEPLTI